jgi:LPS-assembly lipoprotein
VVLAETRGKSILSLNSLGRVREYLLSYTLSYTVRDAKGAELLPPPRSRCAGTWPSTRTQVLAKESEEALLYRDMQADLVQQIMRRLAAAKPAVK